MSDLRERVARAMRDVYLARQPKYSGADGYPLEEFFPEADAAIAICMEEAARVVTEHYQELSAEHRLLLLNRAAAIRALANPASSS